jgi:hypothetical protein
MAETMTAAMMTAAMMTMGPAVAQGMTMALGATTAAQATLEIQAIRETIQMIPVTPMILSPRANFPAKTTTGLIPRATMTASRSGRCDPLGCANADATAHQL